LRRERVSNTGKKLAFVRASGIGFGLSSELGIITNIDVLVQLEANQQLVGEALVHVDEALDDVLMGDRVQVDRVGLVRSWQVGLSCNRGL